MLQIKNAWGDPPVLVAWNVSALNTHCSWPYVRCDATGCVSDLSLASTNISGPFPDPIGSLSGLTYIDVSNNNIADVFPTLLCTAAIRSITSTCPRTTSSGHSRPTSAAVSHRA